MLGDELFLLVRDKNVDKLRHWLDHEVRECNDYLLFSLLLVVVVVVVGWTLMGTIPQKGSRSGYQST